MTLFEGIVENDPEIHALKVWMEWKQNRKDGSWDRMRDIDRYDLA
jgi:hypothetical protein